MQKNHQLDGGTGGANSRRWGFFDAQLSRLQSAHCAKVGSSRISIACKCHGSDFMEGEVCSRFLVYFRVRNMEKKPLLLVFDPCSLQQPQEKMLFFFGGTGAETFKQRLVFKPGHTSCYYANQSGLAIGKTSTSCEFCSVSEIGNEPRSPQGLQNSFPAAIKDQRHCKKDLKTRRGRRSR